MTTCLTRCVGAGCRDGGRYTQTRTRTHVCMRTCAHTHMHTHTCMYACTFTHTHTHTHAHTQELASICGSYMARRRRPLMCGGDAPPTAAELAAAAVAAARQQQFTAAEVRACARACVRTCMCVRVGACCSLLGSKSKPKPLLKETTAGVQPPSAVARQPHPFSFTHTHTHTHTHHHPPSRLRHHGSPYIMASASMPSPIHPSHTIIAVCYHIMASVLAAPPLCCPVPQAEFLAREVAGLAHRYASDPCKRTPWSVASCEQVCAALLLFYFISFSRVLFHFIFAGGVRGGGCTPPDLGAMSSAPLGEWPPASRPMQAGGGEAWRWAGWRFAALPGLGSIFRLHLHAHMCTRAHTHTHTHTRTRTHTCSHTHTHTHARIHPHPHTHTHACMHSCMHARTCTNTHAHTRVNTHAQTHTRRRASPGHTTLRMAAAKWTTAPS